MSGLTLDLDAPRPMFLRRHFHSPAADAILRATLVVGLAAIPIILLVPGSAALIPLVLSTLWLRGPFSALIPVGMEPLLMFYGTVYPPWLVTLVAAAASAYAELVSLHLMRSVLGLPKLETVRGAVAGSRVMRLFARRPAVAIAVTAFSPIPDWVTRTLASASGYPVWRYVLADTIGRLPKLFIPAVVGAALPIPRAWLGGVVAGSTVLLAIIGFARRRRTPRPNPEGSSC